MTTLSDVICPALNALGFAPRDMIDILTAIRRRGHCTPSSVLAVAAPSARSGSVRASRRAAKRSGHLRAGQDGRRRATERRD